MTTKPNPVWDVYNEFRTARYNVQLYEKLLSRLTRQNLIMEAVLAVSVSSVIAGSWLWESPVGSVFWKVLITIASFFAVLKPLLKYADKIQQQTEVLTNWRLLDAELQKLVFSISQYRKYDDEMRNRFFKLLETKATIIQKEPIDAIDERNKTECQTLVEKQLPDNIFFVPEETK